MRIVIVGGGIVGLATAYKILLQKPDVRLTILEKEPKLADHQTGHNSGVMHAGLYYKPGSLKAELCTKGRSELYTFCEEYSIAHEQCGKVVVATDKQGAARLDLLHERALANGVNSRPISSEELKEIEPHVAAVKALHVSDTGIVDYRAVAAVLGSLIESMGGEIKLGTRLQTIEHCKDEIRLITPQRELPADFIINCAGLYSDKVASACGLSPEVKIVPFRGEYYQLKEEAKHLCKHLIYPVPDPGFPFLGVHFTRMINGDVECGPNAVLALRREGYTKKDIHVLEALESMTYPGFIKIATKHWKTGAGEILRSYSKKAYVKALQQLIPEIMESDLSPAPAGVRAQAMTREGAMAEDFVIQEAEKSIHVLNAPSPAATASLQIGEYIADLFINKIR